MKRILTTLCLALTLLLGGVGCGETSPDISDLVERDGTYYKKFSDVFFTGKVTGKEQGSFRKGKKVGPWVWYYEDG